MPSRPAELPAHLLQQFVSEERVEQFVGLQGLELEQQEQLLQVEEVALPTQHLLAPQVPLPVHPVRTKISLVDELHKIAGTNEKTS